MLKIGFHSLKCKNLEVEFDNSSWSFLRTSRSHRRSSKYVHLTFSQISLENICAGVTIKFAKVLRTPFLYNTSLWLHLYYVRTLSILAMRILILLIEDSTWLQLIYFLNAIWFGLWNVFSDWWGTYIDCFRVLQNLLFSYHRLCQPLWKIHGIA